MNGREILQGFAFVVALYIVIRFVLVMFGYTGP